MPHSSGGGSHGGGVHGGSHGSSGSRNVMPSSRPFRNSVRYRYYRNGEERFFYAKSGYKGWSPARLIVLPFYIPFFMVAGLSFKEAFTTSFPKKSKVEVRIEDEANIFSESDDLYASMQSFGEKTGISPAVVTVSENVWAGNYTTLESYAYDRYVTEFSDEMHWLIVYSVPSEGGIWQWEGMQGDNTDPILTEFAAERFNSNLQSMLENSSYTVDSALSTAFSNITQTLEPPSFLSQVAMPLFILAFVCFHAFFMLGLNELKYRNCEPAPEGSENWNDDSAFSNQSIGSQASARSLDDFNRTYPTGNPDWNTSAPTQPSYQKPYAQPAQPSYQDPYAQPTAEPTMDSLGLFAPSSNTLTEPSMPTEPTIAGSTVICRNCGTCYEEYRPQCPTCGIATTGNR